MLRLFHSLAPPISTKVGLERGIKAFPSLHLSKRNLAVGTVHQLYYPRGFGMSEMLLSRGDKSWMDDLTYEGESFDGKFHGKGKLVHTDTTKYEGDFFEGMKHGYGVIEYPDSTKYEGEWSHGFQQGHGILTYSNGSKYTGIE